MNKLPSSQLARAGVVGSTAVRVGVGKLKSKAKRPFLSKSAQKQSKLDLEDEEAELLFKAITQLRGTAVKLAQMLGMESEVLPERIREELAKSYHQVPPLNRVLVRKVLQSELGEGPDLLFKDFDASAIAAASLGQVHKATTFNNESLAIKIQYPGIHLTIDSDMKLLNKLVSGGSKLLPKQRQPNKEVLSSSLSEISARLKEETDYTAEATSTRWFHEHLQLDGLIVPKVFDEFCTQRVLATEFLTGKHLDEWLEGGPSQTEKNAAAQHIYDAFFHSAIHLKRVHADPNPGNYLFRDNGEIAIIDFGCVKKLGDRFVSHLPHLLYAFYCGDYQKIVDAYGDIGIKISSNAQQDYEQVLRPFGNWLSLPFREDYFDFNVNKDYTARGRELIHSMAHMPSFETVEEDFIFFDRTIYGLFKIFERLEARVQILGKWKSLWAQNGITV